MTQNVLDILNEPQMTTVCAPMVRYSRLQFRNLVKKYNCDICFTPMIMADSFLQSIKARNNDFITNKLDDPLIVQFAAKEVDDFVNAAEIISPYSNGIDLNCGCPQKWAMKDGYGASLLTRPQLVKDLVYQVRNRIRQPFTVSIKIRLLKEIRKTIELCQLAEKAGVSFITVHARTPQMRNDPIDLEGLQLVRDSVQVPVIANGNVKCLEDAKNLYEMSRCNGVMSANGLLTNPALFSGEPVTPVSCVQDWLDIVSHIPTQFMCMHHHLVFMLEKVLSKSEKKIFNNLQTEESVFNYVKEYFGIEPRPLSGEFYDTVFCESTEVQRKICTPDCDDDSDGILLQNLFI